MTEGQAGQNRNLDLSAQPFDHSRQFEPLVVPGYRLELGELAQQEGLLPGQHPRMQQLGEHAFDAVGVFAHVFQKQHPFVDGGKKWRAEHRTQDRQVAAPEHGIAHARLDKRLGCRPLPAGALPLPGQQIVKTGLHDVVGCAGGTKILPQSRPLPGDPTGSGQHRQVQGREIAQADKMGAPLDGPGHGLVGQTGQDPREAVAPP